MDVHLCIYQRTLLAMSESRWLTMVTFVVVMVRVLVLWLKSMVLVIVPTRFIAQDIRGKTVLITGAGGGLGSLMAEKLAALGCHLVLWDINESLNRKTEQKVVQFPVNVTCYTVDVCNREAVFQAANRVLEDVGHVDILVNNAGLVFGQKVLDSSEVNMKKTLEVNTLAHFWTIKAFLPTMLKRRSGHLVTVASSAGFLGVAGMADYCASKFATIGFEESLRQELYSMGECGVKTTLICPGFVNTGMFDGCQFRFPLIMDVLEPDYVAAKTVDAVLRQQEILIIPRILYFLYTYKTIVPVSCQLVIAEFLGITSFMSTFAGSHTKTA